MTPACQRKQTAFALDSQPGMPGQRGSRSGLHRDVAAAGRSPPTLPSRRPEYSRNTEHAAAKSHITQMQCTLSAMHLGIPEGTPWRPQPRRVYRPETSAADVGSRCLGHVATPVTDRHARRRATETQRSQTTNRTSKTRSLRSSTAPGDLDANADANRHLTNCRPDTPDHPQSIGSCDVATTILPTKRERNWECAELRHTPDTRPRVAPKSLCRGRT